MARLAITIDGIVQGVGFRPFVYGLARRFEVGGFVRNCDGRVEIEAEGTQPKLDRFVAAISTLAPPLARVEKVSCRPREPLGEERFRIESSEQNRDSADRSVFISPDVATCDQCLTDMFDPKNRRYLYPFVNCTNCGPRLTIVKGAPYDRRLTTMSAFEMCEDCRVEYEDPLDRRFHAQPVCCPRCGPQLEILDRQGRPISGVDPIEHLSRALLAGSIAAIKGLGGYHLACDGRREATARELRLRKHRDEKPFAIMVPDIAAAAELCEVSAADAALLQSSARPIVLLAKRADAAKQLAESIAPGNAWLGIMLPYTPVHHLLMRVVGRIPLVMTSGNSSDEPIAYDDADAIRRLGTIADMFLTHNRPIHVRCDDSVTRSVGGVEQPIRRSRGYAPQPIGLGVACAVPTLAVGGQLKATFALGHDHHAFISHHLGDLDHFQAARAFERDIALYERLFEILPEQIAHDLHPDYVSTHYARQRAATQGLKLVPTQHHHAHMASCMADNQLDQPVIGVTFDGTGYGTDGSVWGGEFLTGDYRGFHRAAHLRYVSMPGGEKAIHEPWRMALSYLSDSECDDSSFVSHLNASALRVVRRMIVNRFNSPQTSSAGRLFDAVASIAGVRDSVSYEGEAAVEMEHLASRSFDAGSYSFELASASPIIVDTRPIIHALVSDLNHGTEVAVIARRFHATVVEMIAAVCGSIASSTGVTCVVLSGGVFMNALLTTQTMSRLESEGFKVFCHRRVPPNDGGLSLGQIAIAAAVARNPVSTSEPLCASPFQAK